MTQPLSETLCPCTTEVCNTFNCCEPVAVVEKPCVIRPIKEEVCIDYDAVDPYHTEEFFEALFATEDCNSLIVTEDCKPFYGHFLL